jgi:hypothetical protein
MIKAIPSRPRRNRVSANRVYVRIVQRLWLTLAEPEACHAIHPIPEEVSANVDTAGAARDIRISRGTAARLGPAGAQLRYSPVANRRQFLVPG